jgi:cytosine/creatinine deaminase
MSFDLIVRRALVSSHGELVERDIGVVGAHIAAVEPSLDAAAPTIEASGMFVCAGLVESHLHLDKSRIASRCVVGNGSIDEAMAATRGAKASFTVEDVHDRARTTLERCVEQGTTRVRTHVEVDPLVGLRGFEAIAALADEYRWAVDLEICAFPQDGLFNNPGTEELLVDALGRGAHVVGGAPYADSEPRRQIDRIFELASEFDVDVDLHLDLAESTEPRHAEYVCEVTEKSGWGGRVTIGHLTQWSILPPESFASLGTRLVDCGIGVTVLPATDLFLMGRTPRYARPRGVLELTEHLARGGRASLATNNVLNPFTPYGDCSLARIANLYANVTHLATEQELKSCFELVTSRAAEILRATDYGIAPGRPADLVAFAASTPAQVVAEIVPPRWVIKRGRPSVERAPVRLLGPTS